MKQFMCRITCVSLLLTMTLFSLIGWAANKPTPNKGSIHLLPGLSTKVSIQNAGAKYHWSSSNPKIARVGKFSGRVTGLKAGTCTIIGKSSGHKTFSIPVKVYKSTKKAVKDSHLILIGHRGDTDRYPENSLQGVKSTIKRGWSGAEADLYYTNEGEFLCFHDPTLNRVCGTSASIFNITLKNRSAYPLMKKKTSDAASWIPTVEEALSSMHDLNGTLFLHLKAADRIDQAGIDHLASLIRRYNMENQVVIFGYDTFALRSLASIGFTCGLFTQEETTTGAKNKIRVCIKQGYAYLFTFRSWQVNKLIVDYAHKHNIKTVQYKTQTTKELLRGMDIGLDYCMLYHRLA